MKILVNAHKRVQENLGSGRQRLGEATTHTDPWRNLQEVHSVMAAVENAALVYMLTVDMLAGTPDVKQWH